MEQMLKQLDQFCDNVPIYFIAFQDFDIFPAESCKGFKYMGTLARSGLTQFKHSSLVFVGKKRNPHFFLPVYDISKNFINVFKKL